MRNYQTETTDLLQTAREYRQAAIDNGVNPLDLAESYRIIATYIAWLEETHEGR